MHLPWESLVLLVGPPVALFALALAHWLRAPAAEEPGQESQE